MTSVSEKERIDLLKQQSMLRHVTKNNVSFSPIQAVRHQPAYVYRFVDDNGDVIYIGCAKDIDEEMEWHFIDGGCMASDAYAGIDHVEYAELTTYADAQIVKLYLVAKEQPRGNGKGCGPVTLHLDTSTLVWRKWTVPWLANGSAARVQAAYDANRNPLTDDMFDNIADMMRADVISSMMDDGLDEIDKAFNIFDMLNGFDGGVSSPDDDDA